MSKCNNLQIVAGERLTYFLQSGPEMESVFLSQIQQPYFPAGTFLARVLTQAWHFHWLLMNVFAPEPGLWLQENLLVPMLVERH